MSAAEKIVESALAHRHSFDSLSMRARTVVLRGLKVVLDNSKTDEEFEEATALSALLIDDLNEATDTVNRIKRLERHGFHECMTGEPIAGAPAAKACPFCRDDDDWIAIVAVPGERGCENDERKIQATYHVQCSTCGCEGPAGMSQLEAATLWNRGSQMDRSIVETLDGINLSLSHLGDVLSVSVDSLRQQSVAEDAPATTCIESAIDHHLEPAREQLTELLCSLSPKRAS